MAKEPASIRYKNPGAMWGRTGRRPAGGATVATNARIPLKWGSTQTVYLRDGTNQGNNIAVFDTWVQGICAQLDLWRTDPKYKNKRFADAIHTWSGGNNVPDYIAYCKKRVPGLTEDTIMNDAFWNSPSGIAFLKAQSGHEAGKAIPAPAADWIEAQRIVFGASPAAKPAVTAGDAGKAGAGAVVTGAVIKGAQDGWPLWVWLTIAGVTLALLVAGYFAVRWWRNRKTDPSYHDQVIAAASAPTSATLPAADAMWAAPEIAATRPKRKPATKKPTKAKKSKAA